LRFASGCSGIFNVTAIDFVFGKALESARVYKLRFAALALLSFR
jgi:hypothetical protein